MDFSTSNVTVSSSSGKKRIPKACSSCRYSKVRCDEQRPSCGRCRTLKKSCFYTERPKSEEEQKIEQLEQEVSLLRQQLHEHAQSQSIVNRTTSSTAAPRTIEVLSPQSAGSITYSSPSTYTDRPLKRKRTRFDLQEKVTIPDFVDEAVLSQQQAGHYFQCFFGGCDRYVPIFDSSDTFQSIRSRSSLLLNAICAVGCGMSGDTLIDGRMLHVRLTRWLTAVVLNPSTHGLGTVQALLVRTPPVLEKANLILMQVMACWWPERNLLLAIATRMAVELQLDEAFDRLINLSLTSPADEECHRLTKSARTWALLWNLEQILEIDGGNLMSLKTKGVRRCRTLIDKPFSVSLDARLFSQVELNALRTKINKTLTHENDELLQAVQDARIDIAIWFDDWKRIMETSLSSGSELPLLMTNLIVQRHWADAMTACRAVRATGVNDINLMSDDQRGMLVLAKAALQSHLHVMLTDAQYLANFKFAMDFVWAKCAFSFLLLLKLTILLPQDPNRDLLQQGRALHRELSKSCNYGSRRVYLRLLQISIDKYELQECAPSAALDAYVPEEFVFDWDFPGLNLFSSPIGWDLLFDQYSLGDDLFVGTYD